MPNFNLSAFPNSEYDAGLTKREYIVTQIICGALANSNGYEIFQEGIGSSDYPELVIKANHLADLILNKKEVQKPA